MSAYIRTAAWQKRITPQARGYGEGIGFYAADEWLVPSCHDFEDGRVAIGDAQFMREVEAEFAAVPRLPENVIVPETHVYGDWPGIACDLTAEEEKLFRALCLLIACTAMIFVIIAGLRG